MSVIDFVFPRKASNTLVMVSALTAGFAIYDGADSLHKQDYSRAAFHFLVAAGVATLSSTARKTAVLKDENHALRVQNQDLRVALLGYQLREVFGGRFPDEQEPEMDHTVVIDGGNLIREVAEPSPSAPGVAP